MQAGERSSEPEPTLAERHEPAFPSIPLAPQQGTASHREAANGCVSSGAEARLASVSPRVRQGRASTLSSCWPAARICLLSSAGTTPRGQKGGERRIGSQTSLLLPMAQNLARYHVSAQAAGNSEPLPLGPARATCTEVNVSSSMLRVSSNTAAAAQVTSSTQTPSQLCDPRRDLDFIPSG